jgi:Mce-associated membrane protein
MTMLQDAPLARDEVTEERRRRRPTPDHDGSGYRWWTNLATLAVIALAWLVAAAAVLLWQQNQDLAGAADEREDAARVAGDFAVAVLSYDHRDLDGSLDDVLALSTPDWGRQYEDAWFSDQQPVVEELRAVAQVDVRDVMVGEEHDGVLPSVVVFNATIRSEIGTRRLGGSYLRVDLTEVDGQWLVDDMSYLASTDQDLDPAAE